MCCFSFSLFSPTEIVNMKLQRNLFFIVLIVLHLFFFIKAMDNGHVFTKDSYEYLQQAKNIRDHHSWYCGDLSMPVAPALYSQRPPGYGFFIASVKSINENVWFLLLVQNLLSIFNFYLLYRLLQLLNIKVNLLLLIIPLLFFLSQFIYANLIMAEMIFQTVLMLSFYFLIRFILFKETSALWLYQVFITCALLIKPIWYLFPLVSVLFFIYLIKLHNVKRWTITTHLIPLVFVGGIFIHNHQQTNYWEYSSIQRKLMINYNVQEVLEDVHGREKTSLLVGRMQNAAAVKTSYKEQADFLQHEINKVLRGFPLVFIKIELKGMLRFFTDHSRYDIDSFFSRSPLQTLTWFEDYTDSGRNGIINHFKNYNIWYLIYLAVSVLVNAFLLFCLFVFIKQKNIDASVRIILFVMIFYTALLTGPTGTTRFRLPVYLLLLIAFAAAMPVIQQWFRQLIFKRKLS